MKEINQQLLIACTEELSGRYKYERIESLLKQGAEPMGIIKGEYDELNNLYGEVVEYHSLYYFEYDRLFEITKLFCRYGMDISKPSIPYDNANILNPVWSFTILMDDGALPILKYLLDRGLDIESARACWYHAVEYWFFGNGEMEREDRRKQVLSDLRKIMLIASYPHILENDEFLQETIWLPDNSYDVKKFRDWSKFTINVDSSRCGPVPYVCKSVFTFSEIESGNAVWKLGFGLTPYDN
ncbi:MAG: hypothetical protein K6F56_00200 [Oscillospiraceae bacterium]|nr:hypothetical protein [Oscillospiraceae bacterium]